MSHKILLRPYSHIEAETKLVFHFADDIFKCIFMNANVWMLLKIVPKGLINNIPALVQIMAWRRSGDKPLSEPMMVTLLTYICVTRPQWFNEWKHAWGDFSFNIVLWGLCWLIYTILGNGLGRRGATLLYKQMLTYFTDVFVYLSQEDLTHWGQVMHICISKLTIIGSDTGLLPGWCQTIIWINAGILLIGPLGTNFGETLIEIHAFSFKKMLLKMWKMAAILSRPQFVNRNVWHQSSYHACQRNV